MCTYVVMCISDRSFYANMGVWESSRGGMNTSNLPFVALVSQPTALQQVKV